MNKLEQLIQELCPHGVEYKKLGEVCKIKNGQDYKKLKLGTIPVYGSGGVMTYVDTSIYDKPSVLIPRKGSLKNIFYVENGFWNVDTIFYTEINSVYYIEKFFYYLIKQIDLEKFNFAGGVPSLTQSVLNKIMLPVPPLEVQKEIVRILDTFTELENELEKELEARKKQYEFYREQLLFSKDYNKVFLNNISINCDSKRIPITQSKREKGEFPYYGASGIVDYVKSYIFDGDYLLISEDGANLVARTTPIIFSVSGKFWANNHAHILKFENYCTQKYVEHYINAIDISKYISTAAQPKLTKENLNKIPIPLPPLEEQERIVNILDRFDALCNDLTCGLPAEIEARKKQYAYYRDKLLTFKNIADKNIA